MEDCLHVGDHPFDVLCAKAAAGMQCVWITLQGAQLPEGMGCAEDWRIRDMTELVTLV